MREDIKQRIEEIDAGQSPSGYKTHYRVGVLPSDWDMKPLGEVSVQLTEKAGDQELETLSISAGVGFVNQAQKFGKELSGKQYVNYTVLRRGDFSYNKGNSKTYPQGCIYRLEEREIAAVPNVFNSLRLLDSICNSDFYTHLFINGFMNHQLYRLINAGVRNDGLLNLYSDDFYGCLLPVPPLPEQEKIAEILNHCKKVIELKQQLVEEERKRKKWLMQNLLDPDSGVRLQGFEETWANTLIKNVATVISGGTPSTNNPDYWNGSILWCTPTDISKSSKYIDVTEQTISESGLKNSSAALLPIGTVLMCSRASIGPKAIAAQEITTNQGFKSFVCSDKLNNEFLYYLLEVILIDLLRLASGNTFKELSKDSVDNYMITIPDIKEQVAVAEVLSAQDNKIDLLEEELFQWQQKKKALMQLLLTGIVRVSV